jgi:FixJ family two-component response regulator
VVRALRAVLVAESPSERPAEQGPAAALLSRREHEVLKLVAYGLSDREIAEQLILSPHTVHRHDSYAWARAFAAMYDPFSWIGERAGMRRRRHELLT